MRLTCPHCQSLCRLKDDRLNRRAKQGRCPNCGNLFPLPPDEIEPQTNPDIQPVYPDREPENRCNHLDFTAKPTEEHSQSRTRNLIRSAPKSPLFLALAGFSLILFSTIIFLRMNHTESISEENRPQKITSASPESEPHITLEFAPTSKNKAIALIKHHALVTDASINLNKQQFELALLVSGKTPVSYSERLGRQFAHYIKNELTPINQTKATFMVSVYYPDGTRVEVTTNNDNMDEEIILDLLKTTYPGQNKINGSRSPMAK